MTVITTEVRQVLDAARLTHLTTLNQDGSPQVTVVWIGLEGDETATPRSTPAERQSYCNVSPRNTSAQE